MKRVLPALLLLAYACTSASAPSTTALPPTTGTDDNPVSTTTEPAPTTSTSMVPLGIEALSASLQADVLQLVADVQRLRGLDFLEPPRITVLTDQELEERVRVQIQEETEDVEADQALYILLGLLPAGTDLLALYTDLYGEQTAGFYDGETKELVVPGGSDALSPLQRGTLIHELTHALTDQHHDLWQIRKTMIDDQRFDEAAAFLAVIEGDATLVEVLYLQEMSPEDQQSFLAESFEVDTTIFDSVPLFIQRSLLFAYQEGFAFVKRLHDLGDFDAVDAAYERWPVSTEQVLTPRDYLRDAPLIPASAEFDVTGHELVYDSDWGELGFLLMFEQVLGEAPAKEPSDGWGGDRFRLWFDGVNAVAVIEYVGDSETDAAELADALVEYSVTAMAVGAPSQSGEAVVMAGSDYAYVSRSGSNVVFVAATDPVTGAAVVAGLGG